MPVKFRRLELPQGGLDIVGDVHGCYRELSELAESLGYQRREQAFWHGHGRRLVFVGDLVDRGPLIAQVLQAVMASVAVGSAFSVLGNHDDRLLRGLSGNPVHTNHGYGASIEQLTAAWNDDFTVSAVREFLAQLPDCLVTADGKLLVSHAGWYPEFDSASSQTEAHRFCLHGKPTNKLDASGLVVRQDWPRQYLGQAAVVYGHTPCRQAMWRNNTINIDTGCVFGGHLTAVRWPEREIVSVESRQAFVATRFQ